jgi:polar amino acid transport system substrate-binding protein
MTDNCKITRRLASGLIAGVLGTLAFCGAAMAQTTSASIKAKGKLVVGIHGDNQPWGFLNSRGENEGFDADISRLIGKELGVPVEFVVLANAARIPALQAGRVDVLLATLAMTEERAKAIQFTIPYAANQLSIVAPKTTKITGFADLKGKTVGAPKASIQDGEIAREAPGAQLRRFDDDSATIQALISGQVEAVGANQFYIARFEELKPGVYENKFNMTALYNGMGTRQGEKEWNAWLNAFIEKIKSNGELAKAYDKWLKVKVPEFPKSLDGIPFTVN